MIKSLFRVFFFLAVLWGAGLAWFITLIPFKESSPDLGKADAIVVLTGGGLRLERGFELLVEGHAPRMFISGVEDGVTLESLMRKREYQPFAAHIPEASVELGHQARTTIGNAIETSLWMANSHMKSLLLVTGNYHMPRSIFEMHQVMPDVVITPVPVFPSHFAGSDWWEYAGSIRLVISEYNKYITSHLVSLLDA